MPTPPTPATSAAPAQKELWSHEFLDALALEHFQLLAKKLRLRPELGQLALANIERWTSKDIYHAGEVSALNEWRGLLVNQQGANELLGMMTDPGEEGCRLRQSSPFAGILSESERDEIVDKIISQWTQIP
jgi:hypothetical protein